MKPPNTHPFFLFFFLAGLLWCMAFSYSGSSKVQLVMSLILFILYGCSVWKKERGNEREEMVLRKEIFSAVACIMNEGALCLKLQPSASLQGLLGSARARWSHTSHSLHPANRCFHLAQWFDPVEKQITLYDTHTHSTHNGAAEGWTGEEREEFV